MEISNTTKGSRHFLHIGKRRKQTNILAHYILFLAPLKLDLHYISLPSSQTHPLPVFQERASLPISSQAPTLEENLNFSFPHSLPPVLQQVPLVGVLNCGLNSFSTFHAHSYHPGPSQILSCPGLLTAEASQLPLLAKTLKSLNTTRPLKPRHPTCTTIRKDYVCLFAVSVTHLYVSFTGKCLPLHPTPLHPQSLETPGAG